ncbi:uncharacterized protein LOC121937912 [Plectropomus leopardus]|uniref:uncharacterized protein LOC121937912 n=1 Tax=Plectropomus leopardus TaxID=160734 RepID=UPI001C4D2B50|nr:uncharacterized protein LOC121937912 [Plectropomus leopardus]
MEQHQPANVDPMPGQGPGRVPGPLESPAAANMANANGNRTVVVPGLTLKKEQGDSLTRAVLLVDPPLNNMPIITLVSNPDVKDVSMATMKPNSSPGSPLPYDMISKTTVSVDNSLTRGYRGHQKPLNPPNTYFPLRQPEPGQASYLTTVGPTESLSVGCSTEDEWEGIKPATLNHRGSRRSYRGGGGGRGRGGHDPWRGGHRRRGGDAAMGINYVQFSSSHRGRGRERGY